MLRWVRRRTVLLLALLALAAGAAPRAAHAQDFVVINPAGGQTQDDGMRIVVGDGRIQIERNGKYQIFFYTDSEAYTQFILDVRDPNGIDVVCTDDSTCPDPNNGGITVDYDVSEWTVDSTELTTAGPTTWVAESLLRSTTLTNTYLLKYELTYVVPNPYIDVEVTVSAADAVGGPIHLYYATDLSLDGEDDGPGFVDEFGGNTLWGQYAETPAPGAFSGILEDPRTPVTSFYLGYYECGFAAEYKAPADVPAGCTAGGPGGNSTTFGEPFTGLTDAGAAAHWELNATTVPQTVNFRLVYASYEDFLTYDWASLGREATDEPQQCEQLPDMAVSPERIDLTAGGTAQIEVALRNLCSDRPFSNADVLLSLNEQLQVTGVPAGWVNLGNRAAWQNLSLKPGETIRAVITVSAPNGVPAAPSHVTELYYQGRAQKRIDGVFITATPAPAAPVPVVEAALVPVSLPTTLPNTAGPLLPLGALALSGLALAAAGAIGRRLR